MISCPKCSKENQDHYKFCLGCGAELPRDAAPKPFTPGTPPQGVKVVQPPPAAGAPPPSPFAPPAAAPPVAAAPPAAAGGVQVPCPQCGHINTTSNVFCGSCGFRLGGAPKPVPAAHAAPAVAISPMTPGGIHLTALRADGTDAGQYTLPPGIITIGRDTGAIFAGDSYLSPKHATFNRQGQRVKVKDEASLNGVYRKLTRDVPVELRPDDVFRIGQEIVKFESIAAEAPSPDGVERLGAPSKGYVGRIALVIGRETTGNAFPVPEAGLHIGRERGDVLFPEDGYVSGLHCHLGWDGTRVTLTDLGSSNGTFLRIREETEVGAGETLLMGQQLFRISLP